MGLRGRAAHLQMDWDVQTGTDVLQPLEDAVRVLGRPGQAVPQEEGAQPAAAAKSGVCQAPSHLRRAALAPSSGPGDSALLSVRTQDSGPVLAAL